MYSITTLSAGVGALVPQGLNTATTELATAPQATPIVLEGGVGLSTVCVELRARVESQVLPLMSTTHRVEAVVREASLAAAAANRGEDARSQVVMERSMYYLRVKEELLADARVRNGEAVRTPRGKAAHAALAQKAVRSALAAAELSSLRHRLEAQDAAAGGTGGRQVGEVARISAAYATQAALTRGQVPAVGRQRAAAASKEHSAHTLTLAAADVEGAVKIKGIGAWKRRDVMAELRYRKIDYGSDDVTTAELKTLLEAKCSIPGHPSHFRFEMPAAWRAACDAAAEIDTLSANAVKEKAAAASLDMSKGVKKADLVAQLVQLAMAVTVVESE